MIEFEEIGANILRENQQLFQKLTKNNTRLIEVNKEETQKNVCASGWNNATEKFIVYYCPSIFAERFSKYNLAEVPEQINYIKTCFLHEFFHSESNQYEANHPTLKDLLCNECDIKIVDNFPELKRYVLMDWTNFETEKESIKKIIENIRRQN